MYIDPYLDEILRPYTPKDANLDFAIERANRIGNVLVNDPTFGCSEYEIGGSCAKRTALAPLKDVDLFLYMEPSEWTTTGGDRKKPATVLGELERRMGRTYRQHIESGDVTIRGQDHSIRLRYASGSSAAIDVVPALWDGTASYQALIPERSTKEWRLTSVRRQQLLLNKRDAKNRYLRRGIRLLKLWRSRFDFRELRSYAIEILAIHATRRIAAQHPRAVFLEVLELVRTEGFANPILLTDYVPRSEYKIARADTVHILDPAVPGNNVGDSITPGSRRALIAQAKRTLHALERAELCLASSRVRDAKVLVRDGLGLR